MSKYRQYVLLFCHKARVCHTNRQTDGQNYDPQDRASIAVSRGKKDEWMVCMHNCTCAFVIGRWFICCHNASFFQSPSYIVLRFDWAFAFYVLWNLQQLYVKARCFITRSCPSVVLGIEHCLIFPCMGDLLVWSFNYQLTLTMTINFAPAHRHKLNVVVVAAFRPPTLTWRSGRRRSPVLPAQSVSEAGKLSLHAGIAGPDIWAEWRITIYFVRQVFAGTARRRVERRMTPSMRLTLRRESWCFAAIEAYTLCSLSFDACT